MSFENWLKEQETGLRRFDDRPLPDILRERSMPLPLWVRRPLTDSPEKAADAVRLAASQRSRNGFCVYIHVPFCRSHCGYCDCYAFPITPARVLELSAYPDLLCREIEWWGAGLPFLRERPLSTIHFGGGTPLTLGVPGLQRVLSGLNSFFKVDEKTEIALESTSSDLNENVLDELMRIGFSRLHIGVQTLSDPIRFRIGRKESGERVLEKIRYAVRKGWIVSTDVIIGLPGYTEREILPDIKMMSDAGVEGISIYELVRSPRNRAFFERHGILDPDIEAMWRQYQYAFWLADSLGFSHRVYNHMARGRDENRYFTAPARGEELLSFGTIADGFFGDYLYRHSELADYRRSVISGKPGLEGGMTRTERESCYARLERELRGGKPLPEPFMEILGAERALRLFETWIARGYLKVTGDGEGTEMLPNGSWFIQKMLDEAWREQEQHAAHGSFPCACSLMPVRKQ